MLSCKSCLFPLNFKVNKYLFGLTSLYLKTIPFDLHSKFAKSGTKSVSRKLARILNPASSMTLLQFSKIFESKTSYLTLIHFYINFVDQLTSNLPFQKPNLFQFFNGLSKSFLASLYSTSYSFRRISNNSLYLIPNPICSQITLDVPRKICLVKYSG